MVKKYTGYHGTTIKSAQSIIKQRHFMPSNKKTDWLGFGVYFFEEHPAHAKNWCTKVRYYHTYAVLSVELKVEDDFQLDLTNPDHWEKFNLIKKRLKEQINREVPKYGTKKLTDGIVLNHMAREGCLKLVRQLFLTPPYHQNYQPEIMVPTQIQLCVKDNDCINYDTLQTEVRGNA